MKLLDMPHPAKVPGRVVFRGWRMVSEYREQVRYAVESGESVESVAGRFNVTPQRIYQVLK